MRIIIKKYVAALVRVFDRLWTPLLLLISGAIFIFLTLEIPTPSPLVLLFSLFVPGYAFIDLVFSELNKPEKAVASLGFSLSLLVGLKSLIQTFGYIGLFSELTLLAIFSSVLLIVKLVNDILR